MDSLTHIAIGACIGEAVMGRALGKKALLLGAVLHSLPDVDNVAYLWMDTPHALLNHRGITHSLFFTVILTPILAFSGQKLFSKATISLIHWCQFTAICLLAHLGLDALNSYGTGLLEPFSQQRFSLHWLYVADPLFSLPPIIIAFILLLKPTSFNRRPTLGVLAISWCVLYTAQAAVCHHVIQSRLAKLLLQKKEATSTYKQAYITPAPFTTLLWYFVAPAGNGFYTGYLGMFDEPESFKFAYHATNQQLASRLPQPAAFKLMEKFANHEYTLEYRLPDTLVMNIPRFGQVQGWQNPNQPFAFAYILHPPASNTGVVQRGRLAGWNRQTIIGYCKRLLGR